MTDEATTPIVNPIPSCMGVGSREQIGLKSASLSAKKKPEATHDDKQNMCMKACICHPGGGSQTNKS
jgi:hypothetical protein